MLHTRFNQLVDPNNHQKGLTAKGLSSFRVNLFMKRPTFKEIQMQSSLQQLGQTGSLLKEGTWTQVNISKMSHVDWHCWRNFCWWSHKAITRDESSMYGALAARMQVAKKWPTDCEAADQRQVEKIFTFLASFSDDENNPIQSCPAHDIVITDLIVFQLSAVR